MRYREIVNERGNGHAGSRLRIVEASAAAAPASVYTDPKRLWYHGSEDEFAKFDLMHVGKYRGNSPGFWFTDNPDLTDFYGPLVYEVRLKLRSVKVQDHEGIVSLGRSAREARDEGYEAMVVEDYMDGDRNATNICVFNTKAIRIVRVIPNKDD